MLAATNVSENMQFAKFAKYNSMSKLLIYSIIVGIGLFVCLFVCLQHYQNIINGFLFFLFIYFFFKFRDSQKWQKDQLITFS